MKTRPLKKLAGAFTLIEVLTAIVIAVMVFGGMILAYNEAALRAQWSGYQLAAQGLAIEQVEQCRSALWDPAQPTNQLLTLATNYLINGMWTSNAGGTGNPGWVGYMTNTLNMPYSQTNSVLATNYFTLTTNIISYNANIQYMVVRVDTVWPFSWTTRGTKYFTNTVVNYYAPDSADMRDIVQQ